MYKNGSLPEIKFVEIETGLQQAKATAAISEEKLDDCNLYAPIEGYIGRRSIEPGMSVLPGIPAIKIIKIDKVIAKVSVSESEISIINKGQKAIITVGALGYKTFAGVVEEIGVVADPIAHTYKIKIGLPNTDHSLKPGMICDARIQTSKTFKGLIIPNQAVQVDEKGETFVFCVDDKQGQANRRNVEIGQLMNGGIELKKGLNPGDRVVVFGQQKLVDGSRVIVTN
jgi:membrane fusion protein (multidrug efflux system)